MNRAPMFLVLGLAWLAGCGTLPAIRPVALPAGGQLPEEACAAVFPSGPFGVVHALEVSLPRLKKKAL
jgi:hypothetical protein